MKAVGVERMDRVPAELQDKRLPTRVCFKDNIYNHNTDLKSLHRILH